MTRTAPANKVDRDKLHAYLRRTANSRGMLTLSHAALAEDLGIRPDHLGRIMGEMCNAGRMKRMNQSHQGVTYFVREPAEWAAEVGYRPPRR